MKTEAADIDKDQLLRCVAAGYGLDLRSIAFLPRGEDAYAYVAIDHDGTRFFVRAQSPNRIAPKEHVYHLVYTLHHKAGLPAAVAPYRSLDGTFTINHRRYAVAVFPYIEGETLYARGASERDLSAAAGILAALHQVQVIAENKPSAREAFDNPFKDPILAALRALDAPSRPKDVVERKLRELLAAGRGDVLKALHDFEGLSRKALTATSEWVITHGDPNLDNFIKDDAGQLHLTDWGEIALGPPERDLFAFTGPDFAAFLGPYAQTCTGAKLHIDILAFYIFRWCLQEVADYTTRILFQDLNLDEREHALAELLPYLPIRHEAIAYGIAEAHAVLEQVEFGQR